MSTDPAQRDLRALFQHLPNLPGKGQRPGPAACRFVSSQGQSSRTSVRRSRGGSSRYAAKIASAQQQTRGQSSRRCVHIAAKERAVSVHMRETRVMKVCSSGSSHKAVKHKAAKHKACAHIREEPQGSQAQGAHTLLITGSQAQGVCAFEVGATRQSSTKGVRAHWQTLSGVGISHRRQWVAAEQPDAWGRGAMNTRSGVQDGCALASQHAQLQHTKKGFGCLHGDDTDHGTCLKAWTSPWTTLKHTETEGH
eukprot:1145757-Pelagomonas_calceolata.AAC.16